MTIYPFVSSVISPLKDAYLKTVDFELDPLSADLSALENETDPPERRKTFSVLVRGSNGKRVLTRYDWGTLIPGSGYRLKWKNGVATVENGQAANVNGALGLNATTNLDLGLADIQSLSAADLAARLKTSFAASEQLLTNASGQIPGLKNAGPRDYLLMASYLKLTAIDAANPASYAKTSAELKGLLTTAEKIQLVQAIGGAAGGRDKYDYVRAGGKNPDNADGTPGVSLSGPYGKSIPPLAVLANLHKDGHLGVCRDIAPLQTKLLSDLGFKKVYTIGYNPGINHAAVIAQNPDDPNQILHFNYDGMEKGDLRDGMASLTRGEDYSSRYDIYDASGKSVATLPSELGTLMLEGEGGDIKTLDPFLFRPQGSIAQLSLDGKHAKYPVFVGQTSSGSQIVGVGNTLRFGDPNRNVVSVTNSVGVVYERKDASVYSDRKQTFDALHANITTALAVNSHWTDLKSTSGGTVSGRLTTTTVVHGDGTMSGMANGQKDLAGDYSATLEVGADGKYVSNDGKTKVIARIANQFALGSTDVSSGYPDRVYTNLSYVSVTGEQVVLPDKLTATFNTAVGLREFGPQVLVDAGAKLPKSGIQADVGYQGALKKDAFTIAPGMQREFFANFQKEFKNSLVMTASYQQPIGFTPIVQVGAKASLTELLKKKKKSPKFGN